MLIKIFKRILPIAFLFLLVFEIQRSFTEFPRISTPTLSSNVPISVSNSLDIYSYFKDASVFFYFTTLSNIFFVLILVLSWTLNIKINKYIKLASLTYMIITGIVFWTSIAPFFNWGANSYFDFMSIHEHLLVVLMALVWYHFEKERDLKLSKSFGVSMIFPIVYLLVAIIIQAVSNGEVAIYPFLNFKNIFGLDLSLGLSIFIGILIIISIALGIWLISYLYISPRLSRALNRIFKK